MRYRGETAMALASTPIPAADAPSGARARVRPALIAIGLSFASTLAPHAQAAAAPAPRVEQRAAAQREADRVHFATPRQGFAALVDALRANDAGQLARLLGPGHAAIVDSGDAAADRDAAARFVADYDRRHVVQMDGETKALVLIGETEWPMPVPLVRSAEGWSFDAAAGAKELLARRIGRNELDTIQTCLAFVDMQGDYAAVDRDGDGLLEYAARLASTPGKRDGLYWPTQAGEPPSPGGPLFARAGEPVRQGVATPYHGYYFRILTRQGRSAPDGALSYYANGHLIGGVALIAYPAKYRSTGVKTFVCNMNARVFEKDLGPETAAKAKRITAYDPDEIWKRAD